MTFLAPGFLWLLALVPLLWFWPQRVTDRTHGAIRTLVFVALILGLGRPVLLDAAEQPHHVVILDATASRTAAAAAQAQAVVRRLAADLPDGPRTLVWLGAPAPTQGTPLAAAFPSRIDLPGAHSSISAALAAAATVIPAGAPGAVTLVSDGLATDTQWGPAIQALQRRGIPLHTVQLESTNPDPRVVSAVFDQTIRVGHTAKARVRLLGRAGNVRVTLQSEGKSLAQRGGLTLTGPLDLMLAFEPPAAGFRDLTVRLDASNDPNPATNTLTKRVAVQEPLRLLYLGDRMQGGRDRLAELLGTGYEVSEPRPDDGPELLAAADVVMLDDRPAQKLTPEWQKGIVEAVQQRGVGLLASGGRAAFGSGGYHRTEIEKILPIEFVQKEEKKDPSTTLAIIIDSSGSMVGNRMTLAKQVARLAMRRLQPHDKIGIVEFYGTKSWAAPIQSAANQIDLQRALNRLDAGGGTVLMPAIEEAYYAMKNVQTRYKHVLVLTDAGVETGDYESLLRRMSDEGMTVSTVLVGPGRHSDFLVDLADWGGGRYYNATDRFNLPELLLKKPSTSILPAYRPERVEVETSGGPGWWGDLDPSNLPPLDGFVECELRPGAEELIATKKTATPVLATNLAGLGRVTALMTEPLGAGTRSWSRWTGYGTLLGRVLARTARGHQPPFDWRLERRADRIALIAQRIVRADLTPQFQTIAADGTRSAPQALREVAPGLFEHRRYWPSAEAFEVVGHAMRDGVAIDQAFLVSGAGADRAPETQVDPAASFPMAAAAASTGGRTLAVDTAPFAIPTAAGQAPVRLRMLWPWLVLVALLLFALDVFHRRRAPRTAR